jgi:hypothetical protein
MFGSSYVSLHYSYSAAGPIFAWALEPYLSWKIVFEILLKEKGFSSAIKCSEA